MKRREFLKACMAVQALPILSFTKSEQRRPLSPKYQFRVPLQHSFRMQLHTAVAEALRETGSSKCVRIYVTRSGMNLLINGSPHEIARYKRTEPILWKEFEQITVVEKWQVSEIAFCVATRTIQSHFLWRPRISVYFDLHGFMQRRWSYYDRQRESC